MSQSSDQVINLSTISQETDISHHSSGQSVPENVQEIRNEQKLDQQYQLLTVYDIFCLCAKPEYECCQLCVGFIQICCPGQGLSWCCCCYGIHRPDCCAVMCAGCIQSLTSPFIIGCISSVMVGLRMMLCIP